MHVYHSVIHSNAILAIGTVSVAAGLVWGAVSQADEPPQEAKAQSEGKTRLILPPGADRSDPETAALIQRVDEVAGGGAGGGAGGVPLNREGVTPVPRSIEMEPDEITKQLQAVQNLTTVIAVYSGRNGDSLPQSLDQLRQMENGKHEKYLTFKHKDLVLPYLYVSGLDSETIDRNKTPLVLSPILVNGQRIVGRQNGSAVLMDEAEFRLLLEATLEAHPKALIQK